MVHIIFKTQNLHSILNKYRRDHTKIQQTCGNNKLKKKQSSEQIL